MSDRDPRDQQWSSGRVPPDQTVVVKALHVSATESDLLRLFGKYGRIVSCNVMRDAYDQPRGFAFVNFDNPDSAERSRKYMNNYIFAGRKMVTEEYKPLISYPMDKVSTSARSHSHIKDSPPRNRLKDPKVSSRRDRPKEAKVADTQTKTYDGTRVYVKNLGKFDSESRLKELLSTFGVVNGIEMSADKRAESAHVWFADHKVADNACKVLNGLPTSTKKELTIKIVTQDSKLNFGVHKVFVDNLDKIIDNNTLSLRFNEYYGRVVATKVALDKRGQCKGYGFVAFFDSEAADKAVKDSGSKWWGNKLVIEPMELEHQVMFHSRCRKIYVKNLSQEFQTNDMLKGLFAPYGSVTDAQLLKDNEGKFRGFATVLFESTSMAHKACETLNDLKQVSGQRLAVWKDRYSESLVECYICLDTLKVITTIDLGCEHKMCADCARKYFVEHISKCQTDRCKCPNPSCDRMATQRLINSYVNIYNSRGNLAASDNGVIQRTSDKQVNDGDIDKGRAPTNPRRRPQPIEIPVEFIPEKKPKIEPESPEIILDKEIRKCPACKAIIESSVVCNYMICGNCKHQFCWTCNKTWIRGHRCNTSST